MLAVCECCPLTERGLYTNICALFITLDSVDMHMAPTFVKKKEKSFAFIEFLKDSTGGALNCWSLGPLGQQVIGAVGKFIAKTFDCQQVIYWVFLILTLKILLIGIFDIVPVDEENAVQSYLPLSTP